MYRPYNNNNTISFSLYLYLSLSDQHIDRNLKCKTNELYIVLGRSPQTWMDRICFLYYYYDDGDDDDVSL